MVWHAAWRVVGSWPGLQRTLVNEALTPIREAMTIAEATPRSLPEKSSLSTGSVPLSFLTGRANLSRFTCGHGDSDHFSTRVGRAHR